MLLPHIYHSCYFTDVVVLEKLPMSNLVNLYESNAFIVMDISARFPKRLASGDFDKKLEYLAIERKIIGSVIVERAEEITKEMKIRLKDSIKTVAEYEKIIKTIIDEWNKQK